MTKYLFLFFYVFIHFDTFGQKNDNIWPLAHAYSPGSLYFYNLDFTSGSPDTVIYQRKMPFFITNAAISGSNGNFLFYTNGVWIANKIHDTLYNSSNFNPGWATNYYQNGGMGFSQSTIILPFSDTSRFYYLIHESAEIFYNINNDLDGQPFNLSYSIIDVSLDSSRGSIVPGFKNIQIINDTLLLGRITACKHANGRDWWVITHKYYSNIYFTFLFTSSGVYGPYPQQIGPLLPAKLPNGGDFDINGMSVFSPDGTKYAMVGPNKIMDLMDFDRCSGIFSNYQAVHIPDSIQSTLSCSFSANSRFVYANSFTKAYQFDTYSTNIDSSEILIAEYDSFVNPFETWFFLNQLGPDGKIYLSTFDGCYNLHVIENPDSIGLACNFNQHTFNLPSNFGGNSTLPNFPNYRLGRLIGSPCDTLTSIAEDVQHDLKFKIWPNPHEGTFLINYDLPQNQSGFFEMYDVNGRKIYSLPLPQWSTLQNIKLTETANGVYNCVIISGNTRVNRKVAVMKQ